MIGLTLDQSHTTAFTNAFTLGISNALSVDLGSVIITGRIATSAIIGRYIEKVSSGLRLLAVGVSISYTVTQKNTTPEAVSNLLIAASSQGGALYTALSSGGFKVSVSMPVVSNISPSATPSSSPIRAATILSGGAIAGIVIGLIIAVALIGALIYYYVKRRSYANRRRKIHV